MLRNEENDAHLLGHAVFTAVVLAAAYALATARGIHAVDPTHHSTTTTSMAVAALVGTIIALLGLFAHRHPTT